MIGAGALGPQAASAIRHVAVQNGVWSLGNFGGVPPRSAMGFYNDVRFFVLLLKFRSIVRLSSYIFSLLIQRILILIQIRRLMLAR